MAVLEVATNAQFSDRRTVVNFSRYIVNNPCSQHFNLHCIQLQGIHNTSINTLVLMQFYDFMHIRQTDAFY